MKNTGKKRLCSLIFFLAALFAATMLVSAAPSVKLSRTKLSLLKGKSATLTLKGAEGEKVTWSSSRKSVATVNSNGKVIAKKKGTAVITAKVSGKKYSCKVTVKQPVTSIRLKHKSIAISAGKTFQLKATVGPSSANTRSLSWSSSKKSVVTVDSKGRIRSLKPGTAVITAKAKDGSGRKATCRVLVKSPVTPQKDATISLDKKSMMLEVGGKATLKAKTPDGMRVVWGSSDPEVVSVSGGKLTAKKAGTAVIAALRYDRKMTAFCTVSVTSPAQDGESARARKLLAILQKYSDQVKADKASGIRWGYSNSSKLIRPTWDQAMADRGKTGIAYVNCALTPSWAMRELGITSRNFWGKKGGALNMRESEKKKVLKYAEIIPVYNKTPKQLLAEGNLLPGDICTWVEYQHTNVYAGDGLWYDSGRNGSIGGYQGSTFIFNSFGPAATVSMSGTHVGNIIRLK